MLSREEKERRVIELAEQGKSSREIAKEVHKSFGDIAVIIRRHSGEAKAETRKEGGSGVVVSKDTQVFKHFELHKSPMEVTIELDLKPDEVSKLYNQWLELKGLHEVKQLYDERKQLDGDLSEFLELHSLIKTEGVKPRQLLNAAFYLSQISVLEDTVKVLKGEVGSSENQKQKLTAELVSYRSEKATLLRDMDSLSPLITGHKQEISDLIDRVTQLERNIARLKNGREYHTVRAVAEQKIRDVLEDSQFILVSAFFGVIQALAREPNLKLLMSCSLTSPIYDPRTRIPPQNFVEPPSRGVEISC